MSSDELLKVENLKKYFPIKKGVFARTVSHVRAVDGVSFSIGKGETLGLVGESGCGKTTAGRTLLNLLKPTEGNITFNGSDVFNSSKKTMQSLRKQMQIIFQDPYASLNPRMTINDIVGEGLLVHKILPCKNKRDKRVAELLERVGLPSEYALRYPHEFSGGQRQRIGIARALAVEPSFIVCDESVSALDVSVQAQIINLLVDLQKELNMSYLFIAHDLAVVEHIASEIAVMYLGRIVEQAPTDVIFKNPQHPYTKALLSAIPYPDPTNKTKRIPIDNDIIMPTEKPTHCPFYERCFMSNDKCSHTVPELKSIANKHKCACIHASKY